MKSYDAIIIGAGPGGIICASILKKAGMKVILLEKSNALGKKACASGLTRKDVEYLGIPHKELDFCFTEITLHTRWQRIVGKASKPILFTISREKLARWMVNHYGVKPRMNAMVTEIGKDYVIVNKKEKIYFKYLIGADGSASIVRKRLGLKTEKLCLGMHYIVKGNKYNAIELFFDSSLLKNSYFWIFPHKGYASIGCGAEPSAISPDVLRHNFKKWLKNKHIDVSTAKFEAFPINFDYQGYKFGNKFLIGDAAGLAYDATGEGIYQAMASAEDIANIILDKSYKPKHIPEILAIKEKQRKFADFLLKLGPIRGLALELLAFFARFRFIQKIAKGAFA